MRNLALSIVAKRRYFCVLILAFTIGCSSYEDRTETQMIGTWKTQSNEVTNIITLHSDGTFVTDVEQSMIGGLLVAKGTVSGEWAVKDGRFTGVVKRSTEKDVIGYEWSDRILKVTEAQMVFKSPNGEIEDWRRK